MFLPLQRLQEEITKMSPTLNRNALYIKSVSRLPLLFVLSFQTVIHVYGLEYKTNFGFLSSC